jgi:hypothetical protein
MDKTLLPFALLLLGSCACTPESEPQDPPNDLGPPVAESCPAEDYQGLIGSPLAAVTYPSDLNARVVRPGDVMTMEYRGDRMNIRVDDEGVITQVTCG